MQHFSFLTLAFLGLGFSIISTMFTARETPQQIADYDFTVPNVVMSDPNTQYLDLSCAISRSCMESLVSQAVLPGKITVESPPHIAGSLH